MQQTLFLTQEYSLHWQHWLVRSHCYTLQDGNVIEVKTDALDTCVETKAAALHACFLSAV